MSLLLNDYVFLTDFFSPTQFLFVCFIEVPKNTFLILKDLSFLIIENCWFQSYLFSWISSALFLNVKYEKRSGSLTRGNYKNPKEIIIYI